LSSKGPAVSLITPTVQLVTTCNHARTEQWTKQDRVREQAQQWVEAVNAQQNAKIQTQGAQSIVSSKQAIMEPTGTLGCEMELGISDLAGIQITNNDASAVAATSAEISRRDTTYIKR
jgi:hypothetical protein